MTPTAMECHGGVDSAKSETHLFDHHRGRSQSIRMTAEMQSGRSLLADFGSRTSPRLPEKLVTTQTVVDKHRSHQWRSSDSIAIETVVSKRVERSEQQVSRRRCRTLARNCSCSWITHGHRTTAAPASTTAKRHAPCNRKRWWRRHNR